MGKKPSHIQTICRNSVKSWNRVDEACCLFQRQDFTTHLVVRIFFPVRGNCSQFSLLKSLSRSAELLPHWEDSNFKSAVKWRGSWLLWVRPAHIFYPLDTLVLLNSISKKFYVYPTSAKETEGVKKQAVLKPFISRVRKYFPLFTTSSSGLASKFLSFQSGGGTRSSTHTSQPCPRSEAKNVHSRCHSETAGNGMPTVSL